MEYTPQETKNRDPDWLLFQSLEPVTRGMGMALIEFSVFRGKGRGGKSSAQIRTVVLSTAAAVTGLEDCSRVHRGILPRLELAFPGQDLYLEVSSPGIDRIIKDGSEFAHYIGRGVRCYRSDISDWTAGVLRAMDEEKIVLEGEAGEIALPYEIIAKAKLDAAPIRTGGKTGGNGYVGGD